MASLAINLRKQISGANVVPAFFCLIAIEVNHAVFRLGMLPPIWTAACVLVLAAIFLLAPSLDIAAEPPGRLQYRHVAIGLVAGLEFDRIWRNNRVGREQCLALMQQTCRNFLSRVEGGEVVGALGVR